MQLDQIIENCNNKNITVLEFIDHFLEHLISIEDDPIKHEQLMKIYSESWLDNAKKWAGNAAQTVGNVVGKIGNKFTKGYEQSMGVNNQKEILERVHEMLKNSGLLYHRDLEKVLQDVWNKVNQESDVAPERSRDESKTYFHKLEKIIESNRK